MVIKKVLFGILMLVLVALVPSVSSAEVMVTFGASDTNVVDTVTLVVGAFDSSLYDKVGIDFLRIYEGGNLIKEENCGGSLGCGYSLEVIHPAPGSVDYYAEAEFDGGDTKPSDTLTINYTGTPNTAPVLDTIGDKTVNEVDTLSFVISATDFDNDPLTYSAQNLPTGANFNVDTFTWTPTYDDAGEYVVRFEVDDNRENGVDFEDVTITVNDVNRAPVLSSGPIIISAWDEDTSLTDVIDLNDYFSDPDGDNVYFSTAGNTNINVDIVDGVVSLSPSADWFGSEDVRIIADDGDASAIYDSITLTVNPINDAPVLSVSDVVFDENDLVKVIPSAVDVDGDTVSFSYDTLLDANGEWQTDYDSFGDYVVSVTADDGNGGLDSQDITITVNNVNRAPVWDLDIDDITTALEEFPTFTHVADLSPYTIDDDSDSVSFSVNSEIGVNCEIDGEELIIASILDFSGEASCTIRASDGVDYNDNAFSIDITNINDAPVIEAINDINIVEGTEIVLTVVASDVDGDSLVYPTPNLPTDASFVDNGDGTGSFSWTPIYGDFGVYNIVITVDDGVGELNSVVQESFTLTVNEDSDEDGIPDYLETLVIDFNEPDDGDEIFIGDTINGELKIKNTGSSDVEADIEIILFDETDDDEIEDIEFDRDIDGGDSETFEFEFELDYDLDESHTYILYARVNDGDNSYYKEIDLDIERKSHDIVVEDMRVLVVGDKLEVLVGLLNQGKKDEEVYVELDIVGLGLGKTSERFNLGDWESDSNQMYKKFVFDLEPDVEAGMYDAEATIHYGAIFNYVRRGFEVVRASSGNIQIIEGSLERPQMTSGSDDSSFELLTMKNITWGVVDFLLLCVVIYVFMWLIKKD